MLPITASMDIPKEAEATRLAMQYLNQQISAGKSDDECLYTAFSMIFGVLGVMEREVKLKQSKFEMKPLEASHWVIVEEVGRLTRRNKLLERSAAVGAVIVATSVGILARQPKR